MKGVGMIDVGAVAALRFEAGAPVVIPALPVKSEFIESDGGTVFEYEGFTQPTRIFDQLVFQMSLQVQFGPEEGDDRPEKTWIGQYRSRNFYGGNPRAAIGGVWSANTTVTVNNEVTEEASVGEGEISMARFLPAARPTGGSTPEFSILLGQSLGSLWLAESLPPGTWFDGWFPTYEFWSETVKTWRGTYSFEGHERGSIYVIWELVGAAEDQPDGGGVKYVPHDEETSEWVYWWNNVFLPAIEARNLHLPGIAADVRTLAAAAFEPFGKGRKDYDREQWKAGRLAVGSGQSIAEIEAILGPLAGLDVSPLEFAELIEDHAETGWYEIIAARIETARQQATDANAAAEGIESAMQDLRDAFRQFRRGKQADFRGE